MPSGVCTFTTPAAVNSGRRCHMRKDSIVWRREGQTNTIACLASTTWARRSIISATRSRHDAISSTCSLMLPAIKDLISFISATSFASRPTCRYRRARFSLACCGCRDLRIGAVRTAEISIKEAQASGHALSLCYALALAACPIALWTGNLAAAARHTEMLLQHSRKHSFSLWSAFASWYQKVLLVRGGDTDAERQAASERPRGHPG